MNRLLVMLILVLLPVQVQARTEDPVSADEVDRLSTEVAQLGWIVYSARAEQEIGISSAVDRTARTSAT